MSTYDLLVVSAGEGGRVAAAAAAASGRRVLRVGAGPGGDLPRAGLHVDPGAPTPGLEGCEQVSLSRGIAIGGRVELLPLSRVALGRALGPSVVPRAVVAWSRARGRRMAAQALGGGAEQRTYRDWVVQRFGAPAYDALFAGYAARRWGPPAQLPCGVARVAHGYDAPWRRAAGVSEGGRIEHTTAAVRALGSGWVETTEGRFEGPVWVDAPPAQVAAWLGEQLPAPLHVEARRLEARDGWEVPLDGGEELPSETHLLSEVPGAFRVLRPGLIGGRAGVLVEGTGSPPDPAALAQALDGIGVRGLRPAGAARRLPAWHPVWGPAQLTRLRAWVEALEGIGVTPVGRLGLCAPLDAGQESVLAGSLLEPGGPGLRELVRTWVEPPVLDPPGLSSLSAFIYQ